MPLSTTDANSLLTAELKATAYTGPATTYLALSTAGQVTDGVTNATTTVTSATASFGAQDVGATISGGTIPAGTTISSVTNSTTVVISAAATGSATGVTLTIGGAEVSGGSYARQAVTWGTAAASSLANSAALSFTSMPATTVRTYVIFDALTAGTDRWDGYSTITPVLAGQTYSVAIGALTATL